MALLFLSFVWLCWISFYVSKARERKIYGHAIAVKVAIAASLPLPIVATAVYLALFLS